MLNKNEIKVFNHIFEQKWDVEIKWWSKRKNKVSHKSQSTRTSTYCKNVLFHIINWQIRQESLSLSFNALNKVENEGTIEKLWITKPINNQKKIVHIAFHYMLRYASGSYKEEIKRAFKMFNHYSCS